MKRSSPTFHHEDKPKKRIFREYATEEPMNYSICILKNWELTEEVVKYLRLKNKISCPVKDKTVPQNCLVIYEPNKFQKIV